MKLIKNIICFLCISICVLSISVRAAVVSDNDASSFVTKAEFEAYKNNVQKLIDDYNNSISSAIDGSIATYLATYDTSGGSTELLDKVFPIGFIILSNQKPSYGTWQEITTNSDRCLWVDSTKTWGTTIAQAMPLPTWSAPTDASHTHTFTAQEAESSKAGQHKHTITPDNARYEPTTVANNVGKGAEHWQGGIKTVLDVNNVHSSHKHGALSPSATINEVGDHSHTVTLPSYYTGAKNSKVQPFAYTIRMWKRTA